MPVFSGCGRAYIESYVSNSPDCECHLKNGTASNGTPPLGWLSSRRYRTRNQKRAVSCCLMSQCRVVQENKRDSRPLTERRPFSPSFICKVLEMRTVSKDANGANMFRISSF